MALENASNNVDCRCGKTVAFDQIIAARPHSGADWWQEHAGLHIRPIATQEDVPISIDPLPNRTSLPDALKVLLEVYPRQGWTQDPGFDDLIKFWLDRHVMFRRILTHLRDDTQAMQDKTIDPARFAAGLSRYGGHLVKGLHEHHTIEDTYYFPKLSQHDPRIASGFDMLDADHHVLDTYLASFVDSANTTLQTFQDGGSMADATGAIADRLVDLTKLLDRHLTDEEDLIVPVLLKFGSP